MTDTVILVDYENIPKIDLAALPPGVRVPFFFGASQKSVPTEFLKSALKLGDRLIPIDVEGHGKNALDFYIAYYLGEYLAAAPAARYLILSRDKGFDPLVKHLQKRGFDVQRASSLAEAFPQRSKAQPPASTDDKVPGTPFELAAAWLGVMPRNKRPRKHNSLVAYLHSRFGKRLSEPDVQGLVDRLRYESKIAESSTGALTYNF